MVPYFRGHKLTLMPFGVRLEVGFKMAHIGKSCSGAGYVTLSKKYSPFYMALEFQANITQL